MIISAWWLRTSSKFSGQKFEEIHKNILDYWKLLGRCGFLQASDSQPLMACGPLLESLNTSGPQHGSKIGCRIPNRLKTKLKGIFPRVFVEDQKKRRSSSMFPLIFCALCVQKFWGVRTFCGNSPRILCPKPKRFLCPKSGKDQKKEGLHLKPQVFFPKFSLRDFPEFLFTFMTKIDIFWSKAPWPLA